MRARTSAVTLAKANERYNKLSIVNSALDLGDGMTLEIYNGKINAFGDSLKAYNVLVAKVDDDGTKLDAMEKDLIEYGTRMVSIVNNMVRPGALPAANGNALFVNLNPLSVEKKNSGTQVIRSFFC